ncbi:MAG: hypothetical protein IKM36_03660 [Oscillospiraceae bacterium]|nr:hypothetical protein [Oscillospiraceae bacterium]MBR2977755.1 hypothetical protein [Oscillospiraceae bacterium]MBR3849573.1 hypothetical protein [Oscillospiraceae bacterium]
MTQTIETTCTHSKKNVLELERELHRRTFRICLLLALCGIALLAAGVFLQEGELIYFGVFWSILFVVLSGHSARKATRRTMKHYKKLYGKEPIVTTAKFYNSMFTAKNEMTGSETKAKYEEVERVIVTQNLYALVLPDRVAVLVDRRTLTQELDLELYNRLLQGCSMQAFVHNKK